MAAILFSHKDKNKEQNRMNQSKSTTVLFIAIAKDDIEKHYEIE